MRHNYLDTNLLGTEDPDLHASAENMSLVGTDNLGRRTPLVCGELAAGDGAYEHQNAYLCAEVSLCILMKQRSWPRAGANHGSALIDSCVGPAFGK
ncbi:hypothetical protein MC885_019308 [Smutsia gigantea]|nr:hypothetical protein MC885_019308 [Smutsia gigantea]